MVSLAKSKLGDPHQLSIEFGGSHHRGREACKTEQNFVSVNLEDWVTTLSSRGRLRTTTAAKVIGAWRITSRSLAVRGAGDLLRHRIAISSRLE